MAQYEHLPIYRAAFDLLLYLEKVVKGFSRYNKYTHGSALRQTSLDIVMLIVRANNTRNRVAVLEEVRIKLEELKIMIPLKLVSRRFDYNTC